MKKLLGILVLGLLFCNNGLAKENVTKSEFYSLIENNGNTGFVLRYHDEKSPSGYDIIMPKNSPPIISDFKSKYGVRGGSRSFYKGTPFSNRHGGIDFYVKAGESILAAADGKVYGIKKKHKCAGSQVALSFGKSPDDTSLFATHMHVGKIYVKKGEAVKRGQKIAEAGKELKTDCGGGMEHLHFHMSYSTEKAKGWGSFRFLGPPKYWINPHDYWTGGKGKPECFVEGKEYPEGLLTLPVVCNEL